MESASIFGSLHPITGSLHPITGALHPITGSLHPITGSLHPIILGPPLPTTPTRNQGFLRPY